jgi:hypothetical protein
MKLYAYKLLYFAYNGSTLNNIEYDFNIIKKIIVEQFLSYCEETGKRITDDEYDDIQSSFNFTNLIFVLESKIYIFNEFFNDIVKIFWNEHFNPIENILFETTAEIAPVKIQIAKRIPPPPPPKTSKNIMNLSEFPPPPPEQSNSSVRNRINNFNAISTTKLPIQSRHQTPSSSRTLYNPTPYNPTTTSRTPSRI